MKVILYLLIIFAAWTGFFVALYIRHKKTRNETMVCYLGQDCDKVIHSIHSKFFGAPVEVLGAMYYCVTAISYAFLLAFPHWISPFSTFLLLGLAIAAFMFSVYLVSIQVFTLKEFCTWCLFSAGLSTIIFFAALGGVSESLRLFLLNIRPTILILYAIGMALGVGAATAADIFFFKFLKDFRIVQLEADILHTLSQITWFALGLIMLSTIGLYLPQAALYNSSAAFILRMLIVIAIILNSVFLHHYISPRLQEISFGQSHHHMKGELHFFRKTAFALGAISLVSWYGALIVGTLETLPFSFLIGLGIYVLFLCAAVGISQMLERGYSRRAFEP